MPKYIVLHTKYTDGFRNKRNKWCLGGDNRQQKNEIFSLSGDKKKFNFSNPSADMRRKVSKLNDSAKYD